MHPVHAVKRIWANMATATEEGLPPADPLLLMKKLVGLFTAGNSYCYLFNVPEGGIAYASPGVTDVLGLAPAEFTVANMVERIHPDDLPWFLNFEAAIVDFLKTIPAAEVQQYKVRYDYRLLAADGRYRRILQQVITLAQGPGGEVVQTFGIHTDITYLQKEGRPVLSFLHLNGGTSYIDVNVNDLFSAASIKLTKREREVLAYLINGYSSAAIAQDLFLSIDTVSAHRKNMLRKTGSKNTGELVASAIRLGLV